MKNSTQNLIAEYVSKAGIVLALMASGAGIGLMVALIAMNLT